MTEVKETKLRDRSVKDKIRLVWWIIASEPRFRLKDENSNYSVRMTYRRAKWYRRMCGGQLIVDYNKKLLP